MPAAREAFAGASQDRKRKGGTSADAVGPSRKSRKERASNWSVLEILDMVAAKKQEFLEDIEVEDARDLMYPDQTKWGKIATQVYEAGLVRGGHSPRDALACKYKWQTLLADYKKVADFHRCTGLVGNEYFEFKSKERKERRLPAQFYEDVYAQMHDWLQHKPTMHPPHSRDLLSPGDGNYNLQEEVFENGMEEEEPVLHAYRDHRHDDPTLNMSSNSGIGWDNGAWTGRGNLRRVPPSLPIVPRHQRQDMDLNAEATDLSSPNVPPPTSVRIPQHMPPIVSDRDHLHTIQLNLQISKFLLLTIQSVWGAPLQLAFILQKGEFMSPRP
jgi:hypothetical protein